MALAGLTDTGDSLGWDEPGIETGTIGLTLGREAAKEPPPKPIKRSPTRKAATS